MLRLALGATLAGALAGLVGGAFRFVLDRADALRDAFLGWSQQWPQCGLAVARAGGGGLRGRGARAGADCADGLRQRRAAR